MSVHIYIYFVDTPASLFAITVEVFVLYQTVIRSSKSVGTVHSIGLNISQVET